MKIWKPIESDDHPYEGVKLWRVGREEDDGSIVWVEDEVKGPIIYFDTRREAFEQAKQLNVIETAAAKLEVKQKYDAIEKIGALSKTRRSETLLEMMDHYGVSRLLDITAKQAGEWLARLEREQCIKRQANY